MHKKKQGFYAALLFLIWPFLSAATAFRYYKSNWGKNVLWAFFVFYGFTFAIGTESESSDIVRYIAEYQELHSEEMTLSRGLEYYEESGEIDVLRTILAISLSRVSDSQPLLTLTYAVIFGFFFSRNLWYIMQRLNGKLQYITILLVACFFFVNPIWNINGFRMWTAAHIFLYGLLPFLCEGKVRYLIVSLLSMAVHFAFLVPVGVLLGYIILGNRLTLYFGIFLFTAFFAEVNLSAFNNLMEAYAPEALQERTSSYRVEGPSAPGMAVASSGQSRRWYAVWYNRALRYSVMALLIGLFVTGREFFTNHKYWMNLFCFSLCMYSAANLLGSLPSGSRFFTVANLSALPLLILYIQNVPREKVMKRFIIGVSPGLLLFAVVALRIGLYSMSATAILGNPVVAYFMMGQYISLNDFLRMFI